MMFLTLPVTAEPADLIAATDMVSTSRSAGGVDAELERLRDSMAAFGVEDVFDAFPVDARMSLGLPSKRDDGGMVPPESSNPRLASETEYGSGALRNEAPSTIVVSGTEVWDKSRSVSDAVRVTGSLTIRGATLTLDGVGITVTSTGILVIEDATLAPADPAADASEAVYVAGRLSITDSVLDRIRFTLQKSMDSVHDENDRAIISHSRFLNVPDTALAIQSSHVRVAHNIFHRAILGINVAHTPTCASSCGILTPLIEENIFEMNGEAVSLGLNTHAMVIQNHFETNDKSVKCKAGSFGDIERNNFVVTIFTAYSGSTQDRSSSRASACVLDENHFFTGGGDGEWVAYGPSDTPDSRTRSTAYEFVDLGIPADVRPLAPVLVVSSSTTWDASNMPTLTGSVVVTGVGVSLTIRGATLDLRGGFLGSRQNGTIHTVADGASRVNIVDGKLRLGHQGTITRDEITFTDILSPSIRGAAITVHESRPVISDVEIANQFRGIFLSSDIENTHRNDVTIDRVTIMDTDFAVVGSSTGVIRNSVFLRSEVHGTFAVVAPSIEDTEMVGAAVGVLYALAPGSLSRSMVTASSVGVVGAIGTLTVAQSTISYNGFGIVAGIATVTVAESNLFHNVVAAVEADASTVTLTRNCGSDDSLNAFGGSVITSTSQLTCPFAFPFPLRFVPHVAGVGAEPTTLYLPNGPINGPYIAPKGTQLVADGVVVETTCDSARVSGCLDGLSFVIGAKLKGGVSIRDSSIIGPTLVSLQGNPVVIEHSECRDCTIVHRNPPDPKTFEGSVSPNPAAPTISWSRLTRSPVEIMHANGRVTTVANSLFESSGLKVGDQAPLSVTSSTFTLRTAVTRADPKPNAAPPNLHSAVTIAASNMARNTLGIAITDNDDSTEQVPAPAILASGNWWGDPCGAKRTGCGGDGVKLTEEDFPPPPPDVSNAAVAPINIAPEASATFVPVSPTTQTPVSFSSTAKSIATLPLSYAWDFGDGSTSTVANPTHTYTSIGTFAATLTVTDSLGGTRTIEKLVKVWNLPPTAEFSWAPASPYEGQVVDFQDLSTDVDGTITSWSWDFGDGSSSTDQSPAHVFATVGSYAVKLRVWDDQNAASVLKSRTVNVRSESNPAPIADFDVPLWYNQWDWMYFNEHSYDSNADGSIVAWSWDFGDGTTSNAKRPGKSFTSFGWFEVCLTVTDNEGATGTTCKDVPIDDHFPMPLSISSPRSTTAPVRFTIGHFTSTNEPVKGSTVSVNVRFEMNRVGEVSERTYYGTTGADGYAIIDVTDAGVNYPGRHMFTAFAGSPLGYGFLGNREEGWVHGSYTVIG